MVKKLTQCNKVLPWNFPTCFNSKLYSILTQSFSFLALAYSAAFLREWVLLLSIGGNRIMTVFENTKWWKPSLHQIVH